MPSPYMLELSLYDARTYQQQHLCHGSITDTMASASNEGPKSSRDRASAKSTADPILRNALRYTISPKEYETLHKFIISRSKVLQRNAPTVARVEKLLERPGRDDYNAAAVRASLRVFLATGAALKAWGAITERFLGRDKSRYVLRL
jgi:hypothetical protein